MFNLFSTQSTINLKIKEYHLFTSILIVFVGLMIRLLSVRSELPPFVFCDERIWLEEVLRMSNQNALTTKVFISGPINIYPVLFCVKFATWIGISMNNSDVLILGRIILTLCSYVLSTFALFKLSLLLNSSNNVALFSIFLYSLSPYVISQNRLWYPDHYSTFFHLGLAYLLVSNYSKFTLANNFKFGLFLGLALSVKYTLAFSGIPFMFILAKKVFCRELDFIGSLKSCFLAFIGFMSVFLPLNTSAIIEPRLFYNQMNFNSDLYSRSSEFSIGTYLFYPQILFLISISFVGIIPMMKGILYLFRNKFEILAILMLPIFSFFLVMGQSDHLINRNINHFTPVVYYLTSFGFQLMFKETKNFFTTMLILLASIMFFHNSRFIENETMPNTYSVAADWLKMNIPREEVIGVNWSCDAGSPADIDFQTRIINPNQLVEFKYFVFSSYWGSPFDSYYRDKNVLQESNFKNLHYYHYDDSNLFNFRLTRPSLQSLAPSGFRIAKLIRGNGPDFIILQRINLGD